MSFKSDELCESLAKSKKNHSQNYFKTHAPVGQKGPFYDSLKKYKVLILSLSLQHCCKQYLKMLFMSTPPNLNSSVNLLGTLNCHSFASIY